MVLHDSNTIQITTSKQLACSHPSLHPRNRSQQRGHLDGETSRHGRQCLHHPLGAKHDISTPTNLIAERGSLPPHLGSKDAAPSNHEDTPPEPGWRLTLGPQQEVSKHKYLAAPSSSCEYHR